MRSIPSIGKGQLSVDGVTSSVSGQCAATNPPLEFQTIERIIEGCIAGNRKAFQALFTKYRERVYALAYRSLGPAFDLDDVVQQIFMHLFESLASFKGLSSFDTWVYRISVKVCTDQLRKKYRKRKLDVIVDDDRVENGFDPEGDPFSALQRSEVAREIRSALQKLSVEKRVAIVLFELEGKSLEEISEILRKPEGTIKSRLFHARRELKRYLKRYVEA